VRRVRADLQARSLLLVVQSFTLSLRTMTDDTDPELSEAAFLDELRTLLERTIAP
ncbi:TetR/AcrR family transcriptional regulator, partial [Streptomyces massasporeus]